MSQSDYVKYRRVTRELKEMNTPADISGVPSVLSYDKYIQYKEFALEKSLSQEDKYDYDRLLPPTARTIFGLTRLDPTNCSTFGICTNTNTRPNRHLSTTVIPVRTAPLALKHYKLTQPSKLSIQSLVYCQCPSSKV